MTSGPHAKEWQPIVEAALARAIEAVLLSLNSREDTVRALEDMLIHDCAFLIKGPTLIAVDYLNRIAAVGLTGIMGEDGCNGEVAAALREMAQICVSRKKL